MPSVVQLVLDGFLDPPHPDAFVGLVGAASVQHGHLVAAGVVQGDQLPSPVEYRAARTAWFGRGAVVDPGAVMVEHQVVLDGEHRQHAAAGMSHDERPRRWAAVQRRKLAGRRTRAHSRRCGLQAHDRRVELITR